MSDHASSVLIETVKLADTLRKRLGGGPFGGSGATNDDVWDQATREEPRYGFATGAAECRYCPICRTIAATRQSGPDLFGHVMSAGESMMAAAREAVASYERSKRRAPGPGGEPDDVG